MKKYYPIMLDIEDKRCVVIGGGKVAQRKVESLLYCGGAVTVITPKVTEELNNLAQNGKIQIILREYTSGDLKGFDLAYVATDNQRVNNLCREEAKQEKVLLNVVDQPDMCDFIVPASVQRGDLTIAVSTNGKSPMLSRKIREDLEAVYGEEYTVFLEVMGELRQLVLTEWENIHHRREFFQKIVYSDVLDRYRNGEIQDLKSYILETFLKRSV
ncbi:precorrin-2 dehydrogenase/sirohydrochlorin ferrochelatase [Anaerosolibacter carboniphilus]|uniref:precorrin-2 dehydrogenase n=1 Tax=Anaerosolibacter carboniphilus TaxID=1417629 RepID=A0A841KMU6_9FIRM|nr:bifunctional precorrin-2 dehydrogenase/sirohydrochlorin ferrochelatase [Anaerosolibacter carboniphilus]MBB6214591.1 precorrin-2 dehydrogenase/sirohydrochlorin ferrochelatase [Anaerosolibacter carboniphilus]